MTSDYQSGASAGREMVANFVLGDVRAASLERGKLYEAILALPLPADPASSEGADARRWRCFHCDEVFTTKHTAMAHFGASERRSGHSKLVYDKAKRTIAAVDPLPADPASSEGALDFATWRDAYEDLLVQDEANRAEITIARCNLLFLEECCRYSLGLAEDLIGDALTKAVGDKVLAMRDKAATLRTALEKIADIDPVNTGTIFAVTTAREALAAIKEPNSQQTRAVETPESRK